MSNKEFIWETHGVHAGTFTGPVKHGVDDLESAIEKAISLSHPSITFIIHTPRLTTYRYKSEDRLGLKFIRGDSAYADYVSIIEEIKKKYKRKIQIRFGIELEWQGEGLGLTWSRAKVEQALGIDFIVASVHFTDEKIAYDESKDESKRLLQLRGGLDNLWINYFDQVISMIDHWGDFIHVVGHLDLPKLYVDLPKALENPEYSDDQVAVKLRTILKKMADKGIAIDINLAGHSKGCGIYPTEKILKLSKKFGVGITIGSDAHGVDVIGRLFPLGLKYVNDLGFKSYLSFSKGSPQVHLLNNPNIPDELENNFEKLLNGGLTLLSQINNPKKTKMDYHDVQLHLGAEFKDFSEAFKNSVVVGSGNVITLRKDGHSVTVTGELHEETRSFKGIYFKHKDEPGVLALLFSILASEGINVDTANLFNRQDGTGEAYLTVTASDEVIQNACEFAKGTNPDLFFELIGNHQCELIPSVIAGTQIIEVDDVPLSMPLTSKMIYSVHDDKPGILFLLLAALSSRQINIHDMRLGNEAGKGHALLSVSGSSQNISNAIASIRDEFRTLSYLSAH